LPLRIHFAALGFVSLPIASLTICVAIGCILASSAILHCDCTSLVAAIAGAHHVLKLHNYSRTADIRCNLLVILQHNVAFRFARKKKTDPTKFPVVRVVDSLKTYKVINLEADQISSVKCD
jgi:hypothetical protein